MQSKKTRNRLPVALSMALMSIIMSCAGDKSDNTNKGDEVILDSVRQKEVLASGKEIAGHFKSTLVASLSQAIDEQGYAGAISFCSVNAGHLTDSIANAKHVHIQRVSHKPRNKNNAANNTEIELIKQFIESSKTESAAVQPVVVADKDQNIFYAPIFISSPLCLNCHGNAETEILPEVYEIIKTTYPEDEAIGFKLKDLRGLLKISFDKDWIPSGQASFIKDIGAEEFKNLVDAGKGIVLDVRTPDEIAQGYIDGSSMVNFYDEQFIDKVNLMDKSKEIYVYCRSGARSAQAARMLHENGFNRVYQLVGGLMSWSKLDFPLVKSAIAKDKNIQTLSLEEFQQLLNTDKPVLVDFHTVWCSPCRKMAPIVDEIESAYSDKAVVMRVDVDKSKEVGNAYNIEGVPVFILFKNGKAIWTHNGIISKSALMAKIDEALVE